LNDNEKTSQFGPVLKSYQDEIDSLTRRSLAAETAFLEFYNTIREAPDPSVVMTNMLVRLRF
jgi:homeobox protein cut-like